MGDRDPAERRAYVLLAIMPLFFSSNLIIGRAAVATVEPWTLAFFRWFGAFLILLPFAAGGLRRHLGQLLSQWQLLGTLGLLGMWICGALVYLALTATTATNATLIYTSSPVFIVLIERFFRGRSVSALQLAGIFLAISGVATIVLKGNPAGIANLAFNGGDVLIGVAAISWAVYSALLKRPALQALPTITLFAAIAFAGAVSLFPFMVWETIDTGRFPANAAAWSSIAGLALVSSVLAFTTFQYGIKIVGPAKAGVFLYLLPPYGVGLAILFLGERFETFHAIGLVLVTTGVVMATAPAPTALRALFGSLQRNRRSSSD